MILLLTLLVIASLIFGLYLLIEWLTHREMVISHNKVYGKAKYNDFVREFQKYNWDNRNWGGKSLWDRENGCEYHASIITMNNIGMLMKTPWDWFLAQQHVKNYFKANNPQYDWSKTN